MAIKVEAIARLIAHGRWGGDGSAAFWHPKKRPIETQAIAPPVA